MTFNGEPVVNWKCVIFTFALVLGYWFLPPKNKWILLLLLYFPYIILAWYDYIYVCTRNMGPTYLSLFYWWAKPPQSKQVQDYHNWDPNIKKKVFIVDIIILCILIVVGPYVFVKL